ncbi:MAG: uracil-DNA glycosylase [Nitrospira sp.]
MLPPIPSDWRLLLKDVTDGDHYQKLLTLLRLEVAAGEMVLPSPAETFKAFELTSYRSVRVILLGQDPYHTPGMAHGLCFSVPPDVPSIPPSLKNIFRELRNDLGCDIPNNGSLIPWARQGVLLLNSALTVRAHMPNSHRKFGWQEITDRVIKLLDAKTTRVVFVLWGAEAQKKQVLIRNPQHVVISSAHPSPLSARNFFGSRCFSRINDSLTAAGLSAIDWQLPNV